MPRRWIVGSLAGEQDKIIRKALDDLAKIKSKLPGPEQERLEEIAQTLRSALRKKGE